MTCDHSDLCLTLSPPLARRPCDRLGAPDRRTAASTGQQAGHPGLYGRQRGEAHLQPERPPHRPQGLHGDARLRSARVSSPAWLLVYLLICLFIRTPTGNTPLKGDVGIDTGVDTV